MRRDHEAITAGLVAGSYFADDPSTFPIASPWSSGELERVLRDDVFGPDVPVLATRASAMRLDGIARGRNKIVTACSGMPLKLAKGDGFVPDIDQPTWLYRTNGAIPQHKIAWTIDDLIFYGWSCWWRVNGTDGFPLSTVRINQGDWTVTADNRVEVNGIEATPDQVILIPGFHEGILNFGRDVLADARSLYDIVRDRLRNPSATTELHQVGGRELTNTERDDMLDHWRAARQKPGGTVGFTNKDIQLIEHGAAAESTLLIEARNAAAVSQARLLGIPAGVLDATTPKASLNYETKTGRNEEFTDDLELYLRPLEARLSMDDVVPSGSRIRFDRTDFTTPSPSPSGATEQD
jgi:hypothetical protein